MRLVTITAAGAPLGPTFEVLHSVLGAMGAEATVITDVVEWEDSTVATIKGAFDDATVIYPEPGATVYPDALARFVARLGDCEVEVATTEVADGEPYLDGGVVRWRDVPTASSS